MSSQPFTSSQTSAWDDEIAATMKMFAEADRLDAEAYAAIENYSGEPAIWARFVEAKNIADEQRTAAYREWMRINRAMKK